MTANAWRQRPDRSMAAAIVGLTTAWICAGLLVLRMVEAGPVKPSIGASEFVMWMCAPLALGLAACSASRVRRAGGYALPGFLVGWLGGLLTVVALVIVSQLR